MAKKKTSKKRSRKIDTPEVIQKFFKSSREFARKQAEEFQKRFPR
jgi:hypothetical protein